MTILTQIAGLASLIITAATFYAIGRAGTARLKRERDDAVAGHDRVASANTAYRARMGRIVAMETLRGASIGKRMAAVARGDA